MAYLKLEIFVRRDGRQWRRVRNECDITSRVRNAILPILIHFFCSVLFVGCPLHGWRARAPDCNDCVLFRWPLE